jgi:hypothetical protein
VTELVAEAERGYGRVHLDVLGELTEPFLNAR